MIQEGKEELIIAGNTDEAKSSQEIELLAVLNILKEIEKINISNLTIKLKLDSNYVYKGLNKLFISYEIINKFKYKDIWEEIYRISNTINLECECVKAHDKIKYNKFCDKLAKLAINNNNIKKLKLYFFNTTYIINYCLILS